MLHVLFACLLLSALACTQEPSSEDGSTVPTSAAGHNAAEAGSPPPGAGSGSNGGADASPSKAGAGGSKQAATTGGAGASGEAGAAGKVEVGGQGGAGSGGQAGSNQGEAGSHGGAGGTAAGQGGSANSGSGGASIDLQDAGTDAEVDAATPEPECNPGELTCDGLNAMACSASGVWEFTQACTVTCVQGMCNPCTPGETQCNGLEAQTCLSNGWWHTEQTCKYRCSEGQCAGSCYTGKQICASRDGSRYKIDVWECNELNNWALKTECPSSCTRPTLDTAECSGECVPETFRCSGSGSEYCDGSGHWVYGDCTYGCGASGACNCTAPEGRFIKNQSTNDVTDTVTGLQWRVSSSSVGIAWNDVSCGASTADPLWTKPTLDELKTLLAQQPYGYSCEDANFAQNVFGPTTGTKYWTGTKAEGTENRYYTLNLRTPHSMVSSGSNSINSTDKAGSVCVKRP